MALRWRRDPFEDVWSDVRNGSVGVLPAAPGDEDQRPVVDVRGDVLVSVVDCEGLPPTRPGTTLFEVTLLPDPFDPRRDTINVHLGGRCIGRLGPDGTGYAPVLQDLWWSGVVPRAIVLLVDDGVHRTALVGLALTTTICAA